jgi:hypothetical protein
MLKIRNILTSLIIIINSSTAFSHAQHYQNLNKIAFDIYRNDKHIGKHVFSFVNSGENLSVTSEIKFEIKKFGVVLYHYQVKGTEIYENGNLVTFNSTTNQNDKTKYVNLKVDNGEYLIDGSSYKGKAPIDYFIGTWWNHSIVKSKAQISAVSGRIIKHKVTFIGKELLNINGKEYKALHFNFSSTDKKLNKDKKLNTDIWYDEESLNWIKASFDKKGKWEYKLTTIN